MEGIYKRVCGLDVHKKKIVACVRVVDDRSRVIRKEVRTFETMTHNLKALVEWLSGLEITHVAMESTGVLWKPIYNLLEEKKFTVLVVNAYHLKQVPGRKTDVKDCEWIAQLLQHGLLRGSFIPSQVYRELRDLTRHRTKLVQQHTQVVNRLHAILDDANIKLSSVASSILGVSGRQMIEALRDGESDADLLAEMARRKLRGKIPELRKALEGQVRDHHRFMLKVLLEELVHFEEKIEQFTSRIRKVAPEPFHEAVVRLSQIPGIQERAAQNVLTEIGCDMSHFTSAKHIASWAGLCPGNDESAGKRRSGKTTKGNPWIRGALGEAAHAASRSKDTYPQAQFRRIAARRGKNRAIVAVSHTLLVIIYSMLKNGTDYKELGGGHFDSINAEKLAKHHLKRLSELGYKVQIELDHLPDREIEGTPKAEPLH